MVTTGTLALANRSIKIPGFYQFGVFISNIFYGKDRTAAFEEEMKDRKKAIRYGLIWILIGLVSLAGVAFLLFVE